MPSTDDALGLVGNSRDDITQFMVDLLKIKAVNPDGGGKGEYQRGLFVKKKLEALGLKVTTYDVPDARVQEGARINITSLLQGEDTSKTLWLVAHLDTVPEGSLELWETNPYDPVVRDGKIFARGSEDNGQAIGSTFLAVKSLNQLGLKPKVNLGIAYVSDEETGSKYGVIPLLEKGVFKPTDIALVPDTGSPDGSEIEIAEKSILWLKITTKGRQVHGSQPEKGLNARRAGMKFALELDTLLHRNYAARDSLFEPPSSTFEPTKEEANVDNVNTVPGVDVQYFDCRILPQYPLKTVLADIDVLKAKMEKETGATIELKPIQAEQNVNPTSPSSEILGNLTDAIKKLRNINAKAIGIGGGTVGLYFRRKGIQTAVWSTLDDMAHQPNEYCKINNIVNDAKVFAYLALS